MSNIFDALQRAEAESAGAGGLDLSLATELLRSAERKMRESALVVEQQPNIDAFDANPPAPTSPNGLDSCPVLAISIPEQSRLVSVAEEGSLGAEKFRFLGVRLRHLRQNRPLKKILITSTIPQEGKSTIAANLACTLARRQNQKTLLLEGDLRRPNIVNQFGIGKLPGLCEWLSGKTDSVNICKLEGLGLWILPAGAAPENPLELMQSGKLSLLMEQLEAWFDWIVIDSPPVLPLADTSLWSRLSDGILLVTRKGITEKQQLQRGLDAIEKSKVLGALVNSSTTVAHSDYYQRYTSSAADQSKE
jgi:capsular exopolysaccharide synthesis family protein